MKQLPTFNGMDSKEFKEFYHLKQELIDFCKREGLPVTGDKNDLNCRIIHYLDTGKVLPASKKPSKATVKDIQEYDLIGYGVSYSEAHREFFKDRIGDSFKFKVPFQRWLKSNPDKTFGDAVEAYRLIVKDMKSSETVIDKQFEYNAYIRDFFKDNVGMQLKDAIECWRFKKSKKGHNGYERSDLTALKFKF